MPKKEDVSPKLDYRNLLATEILGSFDLIGSVEIHLAHHSSDTHPGYTYIHEESHLRLVSTTTFGELQLIIANLIGKTGSAPLPSWMISAEKLLAETIESSWYAHEGYAVFRELIYGKLLLGHEVKKPPALPSSYQRAYDIFKGAVQSVFDGEAPFFQIAVARCIAEASFNTPILGILPLEKLSENAILEHLSESPHRPDYRVRLISKLIQQQGFSSDLSQRLITMFSDACHKMGLDDADSPLRLSNKMLCEPDPQYVDFLLRWNALEKEILWKEIAALVSQLEIVEPDMAIDQAIDYHNRARSFFSKFGIDIILKRKSSSAFEIALASDIVEYVPPQALDEAIIVPSKAKDVIEQLLEEKEAYWILELSRVPNLRLRQTIHDDFIYATYVTPLILTSETPKGNHQSSGKTYSLAHAKAQFTFFGDRDHARNVASRFSERTMLVVLDWTYALSSNWEVPSQVKGLLINQSWLPLTIPQTTNSRIVLELIRAWHNIGIEHLMAFKAGATLLYFCFKLETGLYILVKLSRNLLGLLHAFDLPETRWLEDALQINANDVERLYMPPFHQIDALSVAALDEIGVFYHKR